MTTLVKRPYPADLDIAVLAPFRHLFFSFRRGGVVETLTSSGLGNRRFSTRPFDARCSYPKRGGGGLLT